MEWLAEGPFSGNLWLSRELSNKRKQSPMTVLLSTTFFGPIQWYQKLYRSERVLLEACESFVKQTYRNRCVIATTNGIQALTVPVEHSPLPTSIKDIRISNHGSWRRVHWNALQSAYSESPFFEYYADDLRPFFERDYTFLYDFNFEIIQTVCGLLDIHPHVEPTTDFLPTVSDGASSLLSTMSDGLPVGLSDLRMAISPKHPMTDMDFQPRPYYQVFAHKHGFLPNLSILDLLFNMGPEGIFYL